MFQPLPSEIVFQNYTPCEMYEVPLVLRNNDKIPRLVKVIQETSPYFQIISPLDVCNKVAPGMASTFNILFTPEENKVVPFCVEPSLGTLGVGETMQVTVDFLPKQTGDHSEDLVLHYDTGEDIYISLYGAATDINVRLDKNSVIIEKTFLSLANQRAITISNRSDVIVHFQWKAFATHEEEDQQKLRFSSELQKEEDDDMDLFLAECSADPTLRERISVLSRTFQNRQRLLQDDQMIFSDDIFHIDLLEGDIWPNSTAEVNIVFKPKEAKVYQQTIYCDITGFGATLNFFLLLAEAFFFTRGCVIGPTFHFNVPVLNFGDVSFGFPRTLTCCLHNTSLVPMTFYLRVPADGSGDTCVTSSAQVSDTNRTMWRGSDQAVSPREFTVTPSTGTMLSQGLMDVQVTLCSNRVQRYELALVVDVEGIGEEVLALPIVARCVVPLLRVETPVLEFRRCFLNYSYHQTIQLVNDDDLPACYGLLPQVYEETSALLYSSPQPRGIIEPHSTLEIPLVLQAALVGRLDAMAEFAVFGSDYPPLEVLLSCMGEGPVVHVSGIEVDFGNIPVLTDVSRTLQLSNQCPIPAHFLAQMVRSNSHWRLEPSEGVVPPDGETEIRLVANLEDTLRFQNKIHLVIENSQTHTIPVMATGTGTTIVTDRHFTPELSLGARFSSGSCQYHFKLTNMGRRCHQLYWMTEGFPQFRRHGQIPLGRTQGSKLKNTVPEPPIPVFKLHPPRTELHPGQSVDMVLEGSSDTPKVVKETLICQAIIGKQSGKERIMKVDVTCEFIASVLDISKKQLSFYVEKGPTNVLVPQYKSVLLKNVSSLPLNMQLTLEKPFSICDKQGDLSLSTSKTLMLSVGEEVELWVQFEPSYRKDCFSRVVEECLVFQYLEDPQKDYISLHREVHFPNLHFSSMEVDFGCILNDTEVLRTVDMSNCSPLPVKYRWSFLVDDWENKIRCQEQGMFVQTEEKREEQGEEKMRGGDDAITDSNREADRLSLSYSQDCPSMPLYEHQEEHHTTGVEEVFDILPLYGILQPNETQQVDFTFYGHADISGQVLALCEVEGGPTYEITLKGEASLVRYAFDRKEIDYGQLGFIEANSEQTMSVFYLPGVPEHFHKCFEIQVSYFEPDSISVRGEGIFPRIYLDLPRNITSNNWYSTMLKEARGSLERETWKEETYSRPGTMTGDQSSEDYIPSYDSLLQMEVEHLLMKEHALEQEGLISSCSEDSNPIQRWRKKLSRCCLAEYTLDFGYVIHGNVCTHIVKVTNTGPLPVSFHADRRNLAINGFSTELDRVKNLPYCETETFEVRFDPRGANLNLGEINALMPIQVGFGRADDRLLAVVTMPSLTVSTDKLEFGTVQCGQCQVMTIQFYNHLQVTCEWAVKEGEKTKKKLNDCHRGVVFDSLETLYSRSMTSTLHAILKALNNRRYIYLINLKHDYSAFKAREKAQKEEEERLLKESIEREKVRMEEMDEEEYDALSDEERARIDRRRLDEIRERKHREQLKLEREMEERRQQEQLERLREEEEMKKKNKKGKLKELSKEDQLLGKRSQQGVKQATNNFGGRSDTKMEQLIGERKMSYQEKPESLPTEHSDIEDGNKKKKIKEGKDGKAAPPEVNPSSPEEAEKEPMSEGEKLLVQRFKLYNQSQKAISQTLDYWDRVQGVLIHPVAPDDTPQEGEEPIPERPVPERPGPERTVPSGKKGRKEREKERAEKERLEKEKIDRLKVEGEFKACLSPAPSPQTTDGDEKRSQSSRGPNTFARHCIYFFFLRNCIISLHINSF
ncbi:UNVERIFIED_CONTAM: hypothetical protein FKN15_053855 [Acipenser sinensis]